MDCPEEVGGGLVIACGDGAILFELGEKVLDQMACLINMTVVVTWLLPRAARGDHNAFFRILQGCDHPFLRIVGFVGDDGVALCMRQQDISTLEIVSLSWCQVKCGWITQRVNGSVDLGAQTAAAAANGLLCRSPFFAPALC